MLNNFTLIAHRGFSAIAPENTLTAFALALDRGYTDIEFDVQLSRDGVPVIFHDDTVERTTNGQGRVDQLSFGELKSLDAGAWFSKAFTGERIPSLREVLSVFRGRANLHIELKSHEPELPKKVVGLLMATGWIEDAISPPYRKAFRKPQLIISSYDRKHLLRSMKLLPTTIVHELLVEQISDESLLWAAEHHIRSYNPEGSDITPELVRKAHKLHLHVGAWWWTRENQDYNHVRQAGANYAFVDAPPLRHLRYYHYRRLTGKPF